MKKIYIQKGVWGDELHVHMGWRDSSGSPVVAQPNQYRVVKEEEFSAAHMPMFSMQIQDAQHFMDELWNVGIRPTEGTGSAGSLAATQAHLKDMRAIVGSKLGVDLK